MYYSLKKHTKSIFIATCAVMACSAASYNAYAQQPGEEAFQIVVAPLFEYPVAPEEIDGLQAKSDYLMDHFWDKMDFKNKNAVDQNALNDAFATYITPMRFADAKKADESIKKLIGNISKNPTLSWQFAKAAEESLYGPRAEYWNDAVFLQFIDNALQNKSIKKERKTRYEHLAGILRNSMQGSKPPQFEYLTTDGKRALFQPNGVITLIEFGTPDCTECRYIKLKLETDVRFSSLVDKGKINVLFINTQPAENWQKRMTEFPKTWHVGSSAEVLDLFDMRVIPSLYVIDREGKIAVKNVPVETAMQIAAAAAEQ